MTKVLVIAEHRDGAIVKATLSAVTAAKTVAAATGGSFDIGIVGGAVSALAEQLTTYGASSVHTVQSDTLEGYTAQAYARAIDQVVTASGADYVIAAATSIGKDVMPRVAARRDAGMASDVVRITEESGTIIYTRPMWAGNVLGKVKINTDIQIVTVRGTEFDAAASTGGASSINAIAPELDEGSLRMKYVGIDAVKSDRPELNDADVVISGGRGLKAQENFSLVEGLADKLNGAIGASRAVVDAGWVPNDWQVGQTGKVVAPSLYIAVGISGAIQHLAGMKGSKTIVAINKDPDAPIFQVADYGLVADLFEVVPELTTKLD